MFFISMPVIAQNAAASQADTTAQRTFINDIRIEGFVLGDKRQFLKLFKPYRKKHLSAADMDTILQQVQQIYEQGGYQALVSIDYHVDRKCLTFTVSLIK
jgi:hemolysin activation/secretion protein